MTIKTFLELLDDANAELEQIANELEGWTYIERAGRRGRTIVESIPPQGEPTRRHSDYLTGLIQEYYPNVTYNTSTAYMLFEVWKESIEAAKNRNPNINTFKAIFERLQPFLQMFYPNQNTFATSATKWRTPVKNKFGKNSDVYRQSQFILGISREESIKMKKDYTKAVRERVREGGGPKFTLQEVYDVIDATSASSNPLDNIIAVMLAAGSRMIEVIKLSKFELYTAEPGYIKIIGLAKDRAGDQVDEGVEMQTVIRPVVRISAELIIELVERIRTMHDFQNLSNKDATGKVNSGVNKLMKDRFKTTITGHKCRYIWASVAWQLYGKGVPQAEWVRQMYNHRSADTTLTYLQWSVLIPKFYVPEELRARVGVLEIDTSALKKEQAELKEDLTEVQHELNRNIAEASMVQVQFPELVNPKRLRLSAQLKLERLRELDRKYNDVGIRFLQKTARQYGYGNSIILDYWKQRPQNI